MIRPATKDDYVSIASVSQEAMPHNPLTEMQLHSREHSLAPTGKMGYLVYETDGKIIGFANYMQWADLYNPHSFHITVQVHPQHQQQGIGTELYATLADELLKHNAMMFKSSIYADDTGAKAFSEKYGFAEYSRRIESSCDLTTFDPDKHKPLLDKLTNDGVVFRVLADIIDEDTLREIYELQWSLELDVPMEETLTKRSYQQWYTEQFEGESACSEASIVATKDGKYAGLASVNKLSDTTLYAEFTGTRPHFRRLGLATAMKILMMQEGKTLGFTSIRTTNDAVNAGMLALNDKLGFIPKPARIQIEKIMTD